MVHIEAPFQKFFWSFLCKWTAINSFLVFSLVKRIFKLISVTNSQPLINFSDKSSAMKIVLWVICRVRSFATRFVQYKVILNTCFYTHVDDHLKLFSQCLASLGLNFKDCWFCFMFLRSVQLFLKNKSISQEWQIRADVVDVKSVSFIPD